MFIREHDHGVCEWSWGMSFLIIRLFSLERRRLVMGGISQGHLQFLLGRKVHCGGVHSIHYHGVREWSWQMSLLIITRLV